MRKLDFVRSFYIASRTLEVNMITLELIKPHEFKVGEVLHLKILHINMTSPGRWHIDAKDVTPLPGAEPTGYACAGCGIVMDAKPDGSLPDGWIERKYEEGSCFLCAELCQELQTCRVCGCTFEHACETDAGPCHWVEEDLCSACSSKQ